MMAKQGKREELNIGVNGLRISNLLTQKLKSPFDGVELTIQEHNNIQYQLPASWPEEVLQTALQFFYPEEITGDDEQPQNETNITQVITRVVEAWRWWGDSYSYFNRKTDAVNFSNELKYILFNRIASPNLTSWQTLGIRQTYGIRGEALADTFFIDPDTDNVYAARDSFTHPQVLTKQDAQLIADFYIDTTHPIWQDDQLAAHVVRLITIAQDICILASGYPSEQAAVESITTRYISIGLIPESKDLTDKITLEAIATSAELASTISGNLEAANAANTKLKELSTDNGQKADIATVSNLVKKYGARNFIKLENYSPQISDFLLNPLAPATETVQPKPQTQPKPTAQARPSAEPSIDTKTGKLNSISEEFSIGQISGYLIYIPESNKLIIHSDQISVEQDNSMKVFTKILGLYLKNNLEIQELEEIARLSQDENIQALQKYIVTWAQSLG